MGNPLKRAAGVAPRPGEEAAMLLGAGEARLRPEPHASAARASAGGGGGGKASCFFGVG